MRIGVIGAGRIGATLATRLTEAGHEVVIANSRGPETLDDAVRETGAKPGMPEDAAAFGEVVFEAIPFGAYETLPADYLEGKVVVDASNYYPGRDGNWTQLENGDITSSELVQQHLKGAHVVKAFNTIYWERIRDEHKPAGDPERLAVPIAGDDEEAKRIVTGLIDEIGFDAVDAGMLADSARQQPGTPVYNEPLDAEGVRNALASGA